MFWICWNKASPANSSMGCPSKSQGVLRTPIPNQVGRKQMGKLLSVFFTSMNPCLNTGSASVLLTTWNAYGTQKMQVPGIVLVGLQIETWKTCWHDTFGAPKARRRHVSLSTKAAGHVMATTPSSKEVANKTPDISHTYMIIYCWMWILLCLVSRWYQIGSCCS